MGATSCREVLTDPSPPPQCKVMSWPAVIDEGRTVNAICPWEKADAMREAQRKRVLAKYIAELVCFALKRGGGLREKERDGGLNRIRRVIVNY